jgi:hypothetical protein
VTGVSRRQKANGKVEKINQVFDISGEIMTTMLLSSTLIGSGQIYEL